MSNRVEFIDFGVEEVFQEMVVFYFTHLLIIMAKFRKN